jgi:hypothetical protein
MTRKYMDLETSEYYLFTSPAFSLQYNRQFPSSPVEGGSAVVVPTQKAPPFDEKSLSIERTLWALNMPQYLGGEGCHVRFLHERCCLRKAAGHSGFRADSNTVKCPIASEWVCLGQGTTAERRKTRICIYTFEPTDFLAGVTTP